jgi:glycosyltransferase involved in cell wall biosynthesis
MKLLVISYKACWPQPSSPSGYATDGGFSFQMRALSELFDLTVLLLPCVSKCNNSGESHLSGNNLSVVPLTSPGSSGLLRKLTLPVWLLFNGPQLLREVLRADAVHAPIPGDVGTIGMLLAIALRKPLFVRHCGNWFVQATLAERFWKWFMETFAGGKNICLATGSNPVPPSKRNPAIKWIFATTLTEREIESCLTDREEFPQESPRLIIACRQEKEKGAGVVIESLPMLLSEFPGIAFDVVGDGSSLHDFRRLAASLKISDRVVFHGQVNREEVIRLMRRADLFCFPTVSSEGFPKAVVEAMACGLPVITTRISSLPQLIGNECGVLIDQVTPLSMVNAVRQCLADKEKYQRMSEQAMIAARQYSLERWRDAIGRELSATWGQLRSNV